MLDLGTSFLASVARDPDAVAIVDGETRLSYRAWFSRISALVAGLEALGVKPGDHVVSLLQNRWEAATLHWACQFAGIVITPLNWRATADELEFCLADSEAVMPGLRGCRGGRPWPGRPRRRRCRGCGSRSPPPACGGRGQGRAMREARCTLP